MQLHAGATPRLPCRRSAGRLVAGAAQQRRRALRREGAGQPRRQGGAGRRLAQATALAGDHAAAAGHRRPQGIRIVPVSAPTVPGPNPLPAVVETDRLTRLFGDVEAVVDLSLAVARGQIFGFLGPNGAGKTTTIKMLCGLIAPTRGTASVAGYDIIRARKQIQPAPAYMAQTFSLYPDLTVEENFRFFGGAYGVSGQAATRRMHALFAQIELEDLRDVQAGRLARGQKQPLAPAWARGVSAA